MSWNTFFAILLSPVWVLTDGAILAQALLSVSATTPSNKGGLMSATTPGRGTIMAELGQSDLRT